MAVCIINKGMGLCTSKPAKPADLHLPKFFVSYVTYFAKITEDPKVYRDNHQYHGISSRIPHPCQPGDYVVYKLSNFNKTSKIFKIHKIINHEAVLLNFHEKTMDKHTFENAFEEYKRTQKKYEFSDLSGDGSLSVSIYKLYDSYGKDVPFMTKAEIDAEKHITNTIKKKNLEMDAF